MLDGSKEMGWQTSAPVSGSRPDGDGCYSNFSVFLFVCLHSSGRHDASFWIAPKPNQSTPKNLIYIYIYFYII